MAQILPRHDPWGDAFREAGDSVVKGYTNRSDENAVRKSIEALGANPAARDILNALTNTKTYSPEAKQQALSNYLGVENFEEMKRQAKESDVLNKARLGIQTRQQEIGEQESLKKNAFQEREFAADQKLKNEKLELEKRQLDLHEKGLSAKERELKDAQLMKEQHEFDKAQNERQEVARIVDQLDVPPEQKQALLNASKPAVEDLLKTQIKATQERKHAPDKLSPLEKKIQEKHAEDYIELQKEIPELRTNAENIDYAQDIANKMTLVGTAGSYFGLSALGKELEGVSFPLIKPIVKMFNPSGPIAQQKLKNIENKYFIHGSDLPWVKQAKIDALRRINQQALQRAEARMKLYTEYGYNPPKEVLENFQKENDTILDAIEDYDVLGTRAEPTDLPTEIFKDAASYKGQEIRSPEGKLFYSDGNTWIKR
jgi:hypothetical protein